MLNNLSGMYVLGTLIFALFARGEVQPFNSVSFNQGDTMLNIAVLYFSVIWPGIEI